jgi:hypothetical protein
MMLIVNMKEASKLANNDDYEAVTANVLTVRGLPLKELLRIQKNK